MEIPHWLEWAGLVATILSLLLAAITISWRRRMAKKTSRKISQTQEQSGDGVKVQIADKSGVQKQAQKGTGEQRQSQTIEEIEEVETR